MQKLTALALAGTLALSLAACSDPDTPSSAGGAASGVTQAIPAPYDLSPIETQDSIAALVPAKIKERGTLLNAASTDYAPAEFRAEDGQTPVGYDIEIVKALAKVMGLKDGVTEHADFATILPALGTKFDIGVSSFTITPERLEQVNMVPYVSVGTAYAVAKGNPKNFNPADVCGSTIGVQVGSWPEELVAEYSAECEKAGKPKVEIKPHDLQTDIATKVIGGQYDATFADSTVIGYTIAQAGGQLEQAGEVTDAEAQGIAIPKADTELTAAIEAAMQYLMDEGHLKKILAAYGSENSALTSAKHN